MPETLMATDTTPTAEAAPVAAPVAAPTAEAAPEAKPVEGAPEKYEFKQTESAPVGAEVLTAFEAAARELNLPQDKAQAVIDKLAPAMQAHNAAQLETARTGWAEAAKTDKEFGGDKLPENLGFAKKALDQFGTPELKGLLESSGLGNHPEVIRLFVKAGKAISEDRFVSGGSGNTPSDNKAKSLYPNLN